MSETIAIKKIDGFFDISFDNGSFVEERIEDSVIKHNLFCFGRLESSLTQKPEIRKGFSGSFYEDRELFSTAWYYYLENNINLTTISKIIETFNEACDRDYKLGLFDKQIFMVSGTRVSRNAIAFDVSVGDDIKEFTVNI